MEVSYFMGLGFNGTYPTALSSPDRLGLTDAPAALKAGKGGGTKDTDQKGNKNRLCSMTCGIDKNKSIKI